MNTDSPTHAVKQILIVEDDPILIRIYEHQFRVEGWQVEFATNGEAAIASLTARRPDLVVLDLLLPKINGLEVLKFARAQAVTADVPVIVFTNSYLNRNVHAAWKAGANKCLTKAFCSIKQLMEMVQFELKGEFSARATRSFAPPSPVEPVIAEPIVISGAPAGETVFQSKIRQAFVESTPNSLSGLRAQVKALLRYEGNEADSGSHQGREIILFELYQAAHSVTGNAGIAGFGRIANMSAALEALFKELLESPRNLTPSVVRTVAQAVDSLGVLFDHAAQDERSPLPPTILVVDDEATSRMAVLSGLEKAQLKGISVDNPHAALELARKNPYDLIFLDVDMPGINGFDLCTRLRALPLHAKTPVVFVTVLNDFQSRALSVMSGGNDLIAKPFLLIELAVKAMTYVIKGQLTPFPK